MYVQSGDTVTNTTLNTSHSHVANGYLAKVGDEDVAAFTSFTMPEEDITVVGRLRALTLNTTALDNVTGISYSWGEGIYTNTDGTKYAVVGDELTLTVTLTNYTAGSDAVLTAVQTDATIDPTAAFTSMGLISTGINPTVDTSVADTAKVTCVDGTTYNFTVAFTFTVDNANNAIVVDWQ